MSVVVVVVVVFVVVVVVVVIIIKASSITIASVILISTKKYCSSSFSGSVYFPNFLWLFVCLSVRPFVLLSVFDFSVCLFI